MVVSTILWLIRVHKLENIAVSLIEGNPVVSTDCTALFNLFWRLPKTKKYLRHGRDPTIVHNLRYRKNGVALKIIECPVTLKISIKKVAE